MKIACPNCRNEIPTVDVNVEKDVALCRACNETFSFAKLLEENAAPPVDLLRPPKGVWFRQDMRGFELGSTTRSAVALFLVPFMCVWSGFSLGGIYGTQFRSGRFSWGQSLFGIPFLLGTVVLGGAALMTTFGRTSISVSGDEGRIFIGIGPIGWARRFKWSGIREVNEDVAGYRKNGVPQKAIVLQGDTRLSFASGIKEDRRYFMLNALRTILRKRQAAAPAR